MIDPTCVGVQTECPPAQTIDIQNPIVDELVVDMIHNVNGRWWKSQVGSKEQQTSHSQRFPDFISSFLLDGTYERSLFFPLTFSRSYL